MAISKTLTPTNETIQIPAMTDAPDASVFSNCIDKEADAINALNSKLVYGFNDLHKRVAWGTTLNVEHSTANPLWLVGINAQELYLVANQTGGMTFNKIFGATTTATITRESTTQFTVTRDSNASIYAIAL